MDCGANSACEWNRAAALHLFLTSSNKCAHVIVHPCHTSSSQRISPPWWSGIVWDVGTPQGILLDNQESTREHKVFLLIPQSSTSQCRNTQSPPLCSLETSLGESQCEIWYIKSVFTMPAFNRCIDTLVLFVEVAFNDKYNPLCVVLAPIVAAMHCIYRPDVCCYASS